MIKTHYNQISILIIIQDFSSNFHVTEEIGLFILEPALEELKFTGRFYYRWSHENYEIRIGVSLGFTNAVLGDTSVAEWLKNFYKIVKEKAEEGSAIDSDNISFEFWQGAFEKDILKELKYGGDMVRYKRGLTIYSFNLPHLN